MRFLGVDYGTKRLGLAVSDEGGVLAFPKKILQNDSALFEKLAAILHEEKIKSIVIGESTDFSGKPNVLASKIEIFIADLKKRFNLPVYKQKEFLTSVEARKTFDGKKKASVSQKHSKVKKVKSKRIDASAAALILQRYLDKRNKI